MEYLPISQLNFLSRSHRRWCYEMILLSVDVIPANRPSNNMKLLQNINVGSQSRQWKWIFFLFFDTHAWLQIMIYVYCFCIDQQSIKKVSCMRYAHMCVCLWTVHQCLNANAAIAKYSFVCSQAFVYSTHMAHKRMSKITVFCPQLVNAKIRHTNHV